MTVGLPWSTLGRAMRRPLVIRLSLVILMFELLSGTPAITSAEELCASEAAKVESILSAWMTKVGIPGLSAAIAHQGEIVWSGAYGMAETTVLASGRRHLKIDHVRDEGPEVGAAVIPASAAAHTSAFVSVGPPIACTAIKVVDDDGNALPERRIGHVLLHSTCLLDGYLNDPVATQAALSDGWLRTGDIGYLADGELYFVTRSKDLINVAGRKIAPADVDHAVSTRLGIPVSRVASFGRLGDTATEGIVVAIESRSEDADAMIQAAKLACYDRTGVTPVAVAICAVGSIPKTTSGKVRRQVLRELLADTVADSPADLAGA